MRLNELQKVFLFLILILGLMNRKRIFKFNIAVGAEKVPLDELLSNSDFVISLCILSDETKGMFDKRAFEKMKKSAVFVNCGRSGLVNQDDLLWWVIFIFFQKVNRQLKLEVYFSNLMITGQ